MMNWYAVINIVGIVTFIVSLFFVLPISASLYYKEGDLPSLLLSFFIMAATGLLMFFGTKKYRHTDIRHREGFLTVTLCWVTVSLFGSFPYLFEGTFSTFTDAYFESMAGFTTTGASVLNDIEGTPKGILLWRSITQWLGGMGMVVFSLAVMPLIGGGGIQLFKAEVPEITVDKLRPRLFDTAKALWYIYATLTGITIVLLFIAGMSFYDALCHAFTTLATGGFSTKNTSIAYFNNGYIDLIITVFMFLAGINYTLYFYAFRGDITRFYKSNEFKFYFWVTLFAISLIAFDLLRNDFGSVIKALRYASFQAVSIMTTTGYATADYEKWSPFAQIILVTLMFFGGMIGSTGGGMKQVRILIMFKQGFRELYQLIHPRAVTAIKLDEKQIPKEVLGSIWGFLFLFIITWVGASIILTFQGIDIITATTTVISALCNVGPALGQAGPAENYALLPDLAKWVLTFCMLVGRLEVYTVLVLIMPQFWMK